MLKKLKFKLLSIFLLALTSCANRPYFVIDNQSDKEIRIEFHLDSLNLAEIAAKNKIHNSTYNASRNYDDLKINSKYDSILKFFTNPNNKKNLISYIYDSLSVASIYYSDKRHASGIINLDKGKPSDIHDCWLSPDCISFDTNALAYYNGRTSIIDKLINNNIITLLIPSKHAYLYQCRACGDCSCNVDYDFPLNSKFIKVIIDEDKDDYVILTLGNLKRIMKEAKFERQSGSYVLEIK